MNLGCEQDFDSAQISTKVTRERLPRSTLRHILSCNRIILWLEEDGLMPDF